MPKKITYQRSNTTIKANSIISKIVKPIIKKNDILLIDIKSFWDQLVPENIAQLCHPEKVTFISNKKPHQAKLEIIVNSPLIALRVDLNSEYIIDKINSYLGNKIIHCLKIKQKCDMDLNIKEEKNLQKAKSISEKANKKITEMNRKIQNAELRNSLINLGIDMELKDQ